MDDLRLLRPCARSLCRDVPTCATPRCPRVRSSVRAHCTKTKRKKENKKTPIPNPPNWKERALPLPATPATRIDTTSARQHTNRATQPVPKMTRCYTPPSVDLHNGGRFERELARTGYDAAYPHTHIHTPVASCRLSGRGANTHCRINCIHSNLPSRSHCVRTIYENNNPQLPPHSSTPHCGTLPTRKNHPAMQKTMKKIELSLARVMCGMCWCLCVCVRVCGVAQFDSTEQK